MITIINEKDIKDKAFLMAAKALDTAFPQDKTVLIQYLEGYDCIETPDGSVGFGCFKTPDGKDGIPERTRIYIAADIPEAPESVIECLAHEYRHFMQYCSGKSYSEEDAERFAGWFVTVFKTAMKMFHAMGRTLLQGTTQIENKEYVLALLLPAVQATRAGKDVKNMIYEAEGEAGFYEEAVTIKWNDGNKMIIDVTADSGMTMIRDVLNHIK